ncbi:hypothetical protein LWC34_49770 [Kibdelosporangium philippinense]|uniref:Nuclear transport factor 2 family protein n=2 Tax=Kibdelosporangium philippinense TaxID=211113 RepID=A0ABS8ZW79_9PSEU|nr:hypothetical protein [Kibdelosporangium philippinense]MCE7010841.1 hypothetical protein [Kibdelosporangium philippinense]
MLPMLLVAVFVLSGCSGASESAPVREIATEFVSALADNDATTACSLFAPQAVQRIARLRPEGCAQVLATMGLPTDRPGQVEVWGETAQVKTSGDTLFLKRFTQGWRIVAAGCVSRGEEPYECKVDGT